MRLCKDLNFSWSGMRRQKQYWGKKTNVRYGMCYSQNNKGQWDKEGLGSYLRLGGQGKYFLVSDI